MTEIESDYEKLSTPADLFAFVGFLLQISDAISLFDPSGGSISKDEVDELKQIAKRWVVDDVTPPSEVSALWNELILSFDKPLRPVGSWPSVAHKLLILSDECFCDVFLDDQQSPPNQTENWLQAYLMAISAQHFLSDENQIGLRTICMDADPTIVAVLPKRQIAQVGCSISVFSKNLGLCNGHKGSKPFYVYPKSNTYAPVNRSQLNILIVPFPYNISESDFVPNIDREGNLHNSFEIHQSWISTDKQKDDIVKSIIDQIDLSENKNIKIDGIIFPEYSINSNLHHTILKEIIKYNKNIEFLISGSSDDLNGNKGNFVINSYIEGLNRHYTISYGKHHRWCLDRDQIFDYNLQDRLNPESSWWEKLKICPRRVIFNKVTDGILGCSIICEDLARIEPSHDCIRSIGPDIIFALLMDGPQISNRWSARCAKAFTEDPGSRVLTITSKGLLNRVNDKEIYPRNESIGLFSSRRSHREIICPFNGVGVILSLSISNDKGSTICGRISETQKRLEYAGEFAIVRDEYGQLALIEKS